MTAPTTEYRLRTIPAGLCQCGCGERTPLASKTSRRDGWRAGEPLRFVHGHNARRCAGDRGKGEHARRLLWRDHVLDTWVAEGGPQGLMRWRDFPLFVGTTPGALERLFQRARRAGDPRAVRP